MYMTLAHTSHNSHYSSCLDFLSKGQYLLGTPAELTSMNFKYELNIEYVYSFTLDQMGT